MNKKIKIKKNAFDCSYISQQIMSSQIFHVFADIWGLDTGHAGCYHSSQSWLTLRKNPDMFIGEVLLHNNTVNANKYCIIQY